MFIVPLDNWMIPKSPPYLTYLKPEELTDTQRTLNSLKQEWAGFSQEVSEKKENDEPTEDLDGQNLAYPFGSWVDEQNYRK